MDDIKLVLLEPIEPEPDPSIVEIIKNKPKPADAKTNRAKQRYQKQIAILNDLTILN